MDIQTSLITAVKCLIRVFFGYKLDWIKYLGSTLPDRYRNFAIGLDPKFFHNLHLQSVSENLKLWARISKPNPKPPTQLHMSQNIC